MRCTTISLRTARVFGTSGTIYEQSIRAGSSITKGTNLTLTVAVKPKAKPTPSTTPTTTPEEVEG